MAAQEHEFDDIDLLLRTRLQQDSTEPGYDRVWADLRERIEHQRRAHQADLTRRARPRSYHDIHWQIRCHWHAIEPVLSLKVNLIR